MSAEIRDSNPTRQKRIANGRCVDCKKHVQGGRQRCAACSAERRMSMTNLRRARLLNEVADRSGKSVGDICHAIDKQLPVEGLSESERAKLAKYIKDYLDQPEPDIVAMIVASEKKPRRKRKASPIPRPMRESAHR